MRKFILCGLMFAALGLMSRRSALRAWGTGDDAEVAAVDAAARDNIRAERIRAHVRFLAHDLLEGRGTGQRGGDIAAEYIATQFALYGLKPAGDSGSYMQKVPMVGVRTLPETAFRFAPENGSPMDLKFTNGTTTRARISAEKSY